MSVVRYVMTSLPFVQFVNDDKREVTRESLDDVLKNDVSNVLTVSLPNHGDRAVVFLRNGTVIGVTRCLYL